MAHCEKPDGSHPPKKRVSNLKLTSAQRVLLTATAHFQPVAEYRFHDTRRWRIDVAYPDYRVAVEIDGGIWTRGRHTRGVGITADCEKTCALAMLGWRLLRVTPQQVMQGQAVLWITRALSLFPVMKTKHEN